MSKNFVILLIYHRRTVSGFILVLFGHSSTCSLPCVTTVINSIVLIFEVTFYSYFKGETPIATKCRRVMFRQVLSELPNIRVKCNDSPLADLDLLHAARRKCSRLADAVLWTSCTSLAAGRSLSIVCDRSQEIQACVFVTYAHNKVLKACLK